MGAVLLLAIAGAITLYVLRPKWHDEYGERYKDIAYGSLKNNTYDLYLPHDAATKDSLALMLYVHGGSWIAGNKWDHNIASPISYINDSTALPAIFAYGEKDGIVKPGHYHALQDLYVSLGKPYDLIVYPNSGHPLMSDKDCTERYESTLADYCKKYFGY